MGVFRGIPATPTFPPRSLPCTLCNQFFCVCCTSWPTEQISPHASVLRFLAAVEINALYVSGPCSPSTTIISLDRPWNAHSGRSCFLQTPPSTALTTIQHSAVSIAPAALSLIRFSCRRLTSRATTYLSADCPSRVTSCTTSSSRIHLFCLHLRR